MKNVKHNTSNIRLFILKLIVKQYDLYNMIVDQFCNDQVLNARVKALYLYFVFKVPTSVLLG